jgi:ATP-dependent RNA helicase SUPV3L1/SUV3
MAARARAVEARLSDALHGRLTERFVNRRTAVLMKKLGPDTGLLPVRLDGDDVLVDEEHIGTLEGFRFKVDPLARHSDRKLLLAAAERHVPGLAGERAQDLAKTIGEGSGELGLRRGTIFWKGEKLAKLVAGKGTLLPQLEADASLGALPSDSRKVLIKALESWLEAQLAPLAPLKKLDTASASQDAGPELRALLIKLVEAGGMITRENSGIETLDKAQRSKLAKLGVKVGALDVFVPAMLRPGPLAAWQELAALRGTTRQASVPDPAMPPALADNRKNRPPGYRRVGKQWLRLDMAEKLLREAHAVRVPAGRRPFPLDPARAVSMGLTTHSYSQLLRLGGFRPVMPKPLPEGASGPPAPVAWRWRPSRRQVERTKPPQGRQGSAFAALAELVR